VSMEQVMTRNCVTAPPAMLAAEVLKLMQQRKINSLFVVDEHQQPIGAINMQILLQAGII